MSAEASVEQEERAFHILFVGFMGSGKTTVARELGKMFSKRVIELDRLISRRAHKSIPQIFADEGEEGFRFREHAALETLFDELPAIVSCGGGIVERADNRALLSRLGTVVYLEVTTECALSRISHPETRPLLNGPVPPEKLLEERRPLYEEVADVTVDTTGKTVEDVVYETGELLWKKGIL